MFLLIPLKTEAAIKRIPYLTLGLILINTIIWIFSYSVLKGQMKELEQLNRSLVEIESQYLFDFFMDDQEFLSEDGVKDLRQRIYDGEIIPVDSPDYQNWVSLYEAFLEKQSNTVFQKWGFKPNEFDLLKIITSMFIHANFWHLFGNMLFLWMVGCNVEDGWGWRVLLTFYIGAGIVASLLHTAFFHNSDIPCIGASGAIAGVMGAFFIRYFRVKIRFFYMLFLMFFGTITLRAYLFLPVWFLMELQNARWSSESGTAHWAHIGGFIFGAIVGISLRVFDPEHNPDFKEEKKRDPDDVWTDDIARAALHSRIGMSKDYVEEPRVVQLKKEIHENPDNFEVRLSLAHYFFDKGLDADAIALYNNVVEILVRLNQFEVMEEVFKEMKIKNYHTKLTEKNLYNLATFFEKREKFVKAVNLYGVYIRQFKQGRGRPHALYKIYTITKQKLDNQNLANKVYSVLKNEYPQFLENQNQ